MAKLLLDRGADRTVRVEPHGSPADIAATNSHAVENSLIEESCVRYSVSVMKRPTLT